MRNNILTIFIVIIVIVAGFGCWKLERWLNWKLDYGSKVERRLRQIEGQVEANRLSIKNLHPEANQISVTTIGE